MREVADADAVFHGEICNSEYHCGCGCGGICVSSRFAFGQLRLRCVQNSGRLVRQRLLRIHMHLARTVLLWYLSVILYVADGNWHRR